MDQRGLNDYLRQARLGHLGVDETLTPYVADLDEVMVAGLTRKARPAPPVSHWDATTEALLVSDDGSRQSWERQDHFWHTISAIVFAAHVLIRLGDLDVFPLLLDMASDLPGHPHRLALDVLHQYVDGASSSSPEEIITQARAWWQDEATL